MRFTSRDMSNMLITGSWDRSIRYWDLRSPNPVHTQQLPERVYGMDVKYPLMVVGLAGRRIQVLLLFFLFGSMRQDLDVSLLSPGNQEIPQVAIRGLP